MPGVRAVRAPGTRRGWSPRPDRSGWRGHTSTVSGVVEAEAAAELDDLLSCHRPRGPGGREVLEGLSLGDERPDRLRAYLEAIRRYVRGD
jgi:hypothetical protein